MTASAKYYFTIQTTSGVPIYRQIVDQLKTNAATGHFKEGEFIPSVRQLAHELEINPMTVSKAYSLLEKEGVLEFVRGQGMKIKTPGLAKKDFKQRHKELEPLLKEVITRSHQLALTRVQAVELLKNLWEEKSNG